MVEVLNKYSKKKRTLYKVNETVMFTQMVQFSPFNRIHLGSFKKLSTYVFTAFSTLPPLKTLREKWKLYLPFLSKISNFFK